MIRNVGQAANGTGQAAVRVLTPRPVHFGLPGTDFVPLSTAGVSGH
ncbi:hypothetical protein SK854_42435 [Lentzea sp. BCCO 10_0061]|uniref:Uncharacterized protein n=1 Tax=Lentzea sokolovensis TaxID=3095429 RepID=A0ABU4VAL7_9PSEU|nr:hypothetical protein [Lentzea sp. BCCO 10_0061]MDX8148836.1 hypothetical protein [Lentzea sp. BCCO 10_0061]